MSEPERLMTVGDVAEAARLSDSTVKRAIAAGELVALKIGRATRVRPRDYEAWLTGKRVPRTPRNVLKSPVPGPKRPSRGARTAGPVEIPTD